jgi:hypothetical protein
MATRPSKTTTPETPKAETPIASPPVTFDFEVVNKMIAEAVALALSAQATALRSANSKTDQSAKNELKTIAVFKKLGYGVVKPKVNVLTFNKWIDQGLRPKEGEHATKVANLRLFHRSQCRPLTKEEAAGFAEKAKAKVARQPKATVHNINQNQPSA